MSLRPLPAADLESILEQTLPLWEEIRDARIFITGGSGFFGRWLLESLLHAQHRLNLRASATVLSRDPDSFAHRAPHITGNPAITVCRGDMETFSYPEGEFRYVIHAATEVAYVSSSDDPLETLQSIYQGTAHTLRFAATHGTRKFLLCSSGAVYGKQPPNVTHVPETYLGAPATWAGSSSYGEGKRVSELMCTLYGQPGLECKVARCFAFAGPGLPLDANYAIGNFIGDVLAGRPIFVAGDGSAIRSYLYAADLATWLWTLLFRGPAGEVFNVGSEDAISIADLARRIAATLHSAHAVQVAAQADPAVAPQQYVPSAEKAARKLQLCSTVTLEEGIRRMAAWNDTGRDQAPAKPDLRRQSL